MKIAIIGCGNLGTSLAHGLLHAQGESNLTLCDRSIAKAEALRDAHSSGRIRLSSDAGEAAEGAEVIVLAVKPKDVIETVKKMRGSILENALLVSCASGIEIASLESALGRNIATARAMPNTAIGVGAGTTGVFLGQRCNPSRDGERLKMLFGDVSEIRFVESEEALHAVTALSGSGPAFVLVMLEAMVDAGVRAGLSLRDADFFAKGAFKAAHALTNKSDLSAAELRARITSPGGTTAEGLFWLEKEGFRGTVMSAIEETVLRSEELAFHGMHDESN